MYNMYCFVHNIKNSRRNDHFFPAKVSPKSQKSSKKAYCVKICCPKGAGALWLPPPGGGGGSRWLSKMRNQMQNLKIL